MSYANWDGNHLRTPILMTFVTKMRTKDMDPVDGTSERPAGKNTAYLHPRLAKPRISTPPSVASQVV